MIAWFAQHPTAANVFMAAFLIAGLMTVPRLQRETFPAVHNDKVAVRVVYKGATTQDVEDAVCRRLEDALDSITDLDEVRCDAREGLGTATAVMREGADMGRFLDDVKSAVDTINNFPAQTEPPVVEEIGRTDAVISVAITGPSDPVVLKAYAEDVKTRIRALGEVASVEIDGFAAHQIRVEVPAWRLRQYGLSAADIATAVQNQSVASPAGRLEGTREDILLRFDDQRKTATEFADLVVVSGSGGATVRLGEIATVTDRFALDEQKILFNGQRAAVLNIAKTRAQDTLTVFAAVRDFVDTETVRAPGGIALHLTQDRASIVRERLNMLVRNGLQGLVLVFFVLWLFFSLRYSFWVTMGLPVSFLGALFVLPHLGITINMISMVGLLIGIGLLMDDAIVIAENIAARMARGDAAMHAAITGSRQVIPGIASSFATTVMVFGSLAFISGEIGQILRIIPIVLTVSLAEAFLILPSHLGHSLAGTAERPPRGMRRAFEDALEGFRDKGFGPCLDWAIAHRYATVGLVVMLLIVAIAMPAGGKLKFVGFPAIDGDVVEARVLLPQGTPLVHTEAVVAQLTAALERTNAFFRARQSGSQDLVRNVTVIFGQNPDAFETGPHVARVVADLLSAELRDAPLHEFRGLWRKETGDLTDVIALNFTEPAVGPGGRAIDIRLLGDDLNQVKAASGELQRWLRRFAGVIDLSDDLRPGKREYHLHLKPVAGVLGINAAGLAEQLRAGFQGLKVDEFPRGAETYEVDLRLSARDRNSPADLDTLSVTGPEGGQIPLRVVAEVEETRGWARINRVDGRRAVTVRGDVQRDIANAQQLLDLAKRKIFPRLSERYPGLRIDVQGASNESAKTGRSIVRNILLGLVGVYMLLAVQFRGYLAPLAVMAVIPTALIGVIFGHMVMGLDLTMPSMVGMASLFGVVVNDSILLVVYMREARGCGIAVAQAARQAGRARFRPILLTSITTIAGLTPMLLETSLQAQILIPLAASLAFGLTTTTLIALFLVPTLYAILDDFNALGAVEPTMAPAGVGTGGDAAASPP